MFARAALWNASVFSHRPVDKMQFAREFVWYSIYYNNVFAHAKYTLTRSFEKDNQLWGDLHKELQGAYDWATVCGVLGMHDPNVFDYADTRPSIGLAPVLVAAAVAAKTPNRTDELIAVNNNNNTTNTTATTTDDHVIPLYPCDESTVNSILHQHAIEEGQRHLILVEPHSSICNSDRSSSASLHGHKDPKRAKHF
jgi:hypothetical protein